jgi:hypothetical protein
MAALPAQQIEGEAMTTPKADLTERQTRMLQAGVFHFDSGGDNRKNLTDASDLARRGLITMRENVYSQHKVFQCEVTAAGRKVEP